MRARAGFTLIELMLVLVIAGILAALAIPRFLEYSQSAREAEARPLLKQVYTLQHRHFAVAGAYAEDITVLEGGAAVALGGKYFTLSVTPHASGFCAVATPKADDESAGLDPQSIDANGDFHDSGNCS